MLVFENDYAFILEPPSDLILVFAVVTRVANFVRNTQITVFSASSLTFNLDISIKTPHLLSHRFHVNKVFFYDWVESRICADFVLKWDVLLRAVSKWYFIPFDASCAIFARCDFNIVRHELSISQVVIELGALLILVNSHGDIETLRLIEGVLVLIEVPFYNPLRQRCLLFIEQLNPFVDAVEGNSDNGHHGQD